jgi:dTDP-4-dehydrorhamnose 3,5-epimerase
VIFFPTSLAGAYVIEIENQEDSRGFFARVWCQKEFKERNLETRFVQGNVSYNKSAGTLRGMHYQVFPHEEVKLVRCTRGAIYDVIIDLCRQSPTYCQWAGVELSAQNLKMLYVPKGFAHGYMTLEDNVEVFYLVSEFYTPGSERGVCYDDLAFGITWPMPLSIISDKDRAWPQFVRNETKETLCEAEIHPSGRHI